MHASSYETMRILLDRHRALLPGRPRVADVGASDVNGTYKPLLAGWADYTGIDLAAGPNVDLIAAPYEVPGAPYDAILCGQVLEHTEDMPRLVAAIAAALRLGGVCFLAAPHTWEEHRYPVDCWRIFPDGMEWLLRGAALDRVEVFRCETDTWGVGRRPA